MNQETLKKTLLILLASIVTGALFTLSYQSEASTPIGTVIILKGKVTAQTGTQVVALREGDKVEEGSTISTGAGASAKLLLTDQSEMSVGPNTKAQMTHFQKGDPALIDVLQGQLRAKITRDYVANTNTTFLRSKLLLKTKTATMGVRGTDFQAIFNPENNVTSLVTFEGAVSMVKNPEELTAATGVDAIQKMEEVLNTDKAQVVTEGNFSSANPTSPETSIPTKISPAQFETLKNSDPTTVAKAVGSSSTPGAPQVGGTNAPQFISPIPPGMDAKTFVGEAHGLVNQLSASVGQAALAFAIQGQQPPPQGGVAPSPGGGGTPPPPPPPEGFFNPETKAFAPPAGGFIDLNSGLYIPPPPGSFFDPNAGVYMPPLSFGNFNEAGQYVPPPGFQLDPTRGFIPVGDSPLGSSDPGKKPGDMRGPPGPGGTRGPAGPPLSPDGKPIIPGSPGGLPYHGLIPLDPYKDPNAGGDQPPPPTDSISDPFNEYVPPPPPPDNPPCATCDKPPPLDPSTSTKINFKIGVQ
jgi:hypothetical protein